jgi:uncharacterized protein YdaU (DUF1376 family)
VANLDFKPKFIMWDEDAFRADRIVQRMTPRQRAMYKNLLMECYVGPQRPYLLDSDDDMWLAADAESKAEWLANRDAILVKFTPVTGDDGSKLLQNKRTLEEWANLEARLIQRKNAAALSVASRKARVNERSTTVKRPFNERSAPAQQPLPTAPSAEETTREIQNKREQDNRPLNERSTVVDDSKSKPSNSLSSNSKPTGQGDLLKLAIKEARAVSAYAKFPKKEQAELRDVIEDLRPDRDKLISFVRSEVGKMDTFELAHCPANLATVMEAEFAVQRDRETQKQFEAAVVSAALSESAVEREKRLKLIRAEEELAEKQKDNPFGEEKAA